MKGTTETYGASGNWSSLVGQGRPGMAEEGAREEVARVRNDDGVGGVGER